jgi:hypothetical protein
MEKVSVKTFFTVLWSGVCQAMGWFFGLFGYKRDGKFAKCVWGLFATSAAVVMLIIAGVLIYGLWDEVEMKRGRLHYTCKNPYCYNNNKIKKNIYFHYMDNANGYVYNIRTGEKFIKNVEWIARPMGKDSLVCFSNGEKRGYFNMNTGKVAVEAKYNHAWVFSDGLACVDDGGKIKFIDVTGTVVIDKKMPYLADMEGYVFHGGYCVVNTNDGEHCGLMDMKGNIVLPMVYSYIYPTNDFKYWYLRKGREMAVIDKNMNLVIPLMECTVTTINEGTIDITMPDHTMRKYDMQGKLINDFYFYNVRMLEYEKEEIVYRTNTRNEDDDDEVVEVQEVYYHPKATARLRAYVAGDGYEGLMTADGHVVTMPLYNDIEAIGPDIYLCTAENNCKIVVNGKGERVK